MAAISPVMASAVTAETAAAAVAMLARKLPISALAGCRIATERAMEIADEASHADA